MTTKEIIMDKNKSILHLVHGTFARDAKWIHPDSPLARTVMNSLGNNVYVEPFTWSGNNSHTARESAGTELAKKIRDFSQNNPELPQYIIAHSHGGNVAAYALTDSEASSNIAGVACLGTPFIKARARDLVGSRRLMQSILVASVLMVLLLVMGIAKQGFKIAEDPEKYHQQLNEQMIVTMTKMQSSGLINNVDLPQDDALFTSPGAYIFWIIYMLLLALGIGWLLVKPIIKLWRFVLQKELPRLGELQSKLIKKLTAVFNNTPLLIVDARGDEAAWWLTTVNRIASLPYHIWKPTTFTLTGIAVISILAVTPIFFQIETSFSEVPMLIFMALLFFSISTLFIYFAGWALSLIWPAIFRSHALGFGKDDFLQNFIVEITSADTPEQSTQLSKHNIAVSGGGLHHSRLYQEQQVLELVGDWFKQLQQQ